MAVSSTVVNPVALVVEDKPESREIRINLLKANGFTVFSAASVTHALQEIHSVPALDLVVTDINLDPKSPADRSGVVLARSIRAGNSAIPIVGYSALFSEGGLGGLQPSEVAAFNDYLPKGGASVAQLTRRIQDWRRMAIDCRNQRVALATAEVDRLIAKYNLPKRHFDKLLQLKLEADQEIPDSAEQSTEQILSEEGYQLRIIEPGTSRPAFKAAEIAKIISPLVVWVNRKDDITVAQVYGYPALYGFGNSEDEALAQVLLLMDGFRQELIVDQPEDETVVGPARRLRDFLKHVFG